jgi:uncharacterized membrane protein YvlD (DUF360 family)
MNLVYNLAIEILIIITVVTTLPGVDFEQGVFSMVIAGILLGLLMYTIDPVLGFFRFPSNFWSYLIIGGIINVIFFILLSTVLVGIIKFGPSTIGGGFGPVDFPTLTLKNETYTVILGAFYAHLLTLFVNQLSKYR